MGLTTADKYYLKAKDASQGFFADWEEACESLQYALSYEENHAAALCLLGNINAQHFLNYEVAFECFDRVISNNPAYLAVYYNYAKYLIWSNEIERALKLINYAFSLKGIDKGELYWLTAYALETEGKYSISLKMLKQARIENYNESFGYFLKDEVRRVKKKIKMIRN